MNDSMMDKHGGNRHDQNNSTYSKCSDHDHSHYGYIMTNIMVDTVQYIYTRYFIVDLYQHRIKLMSAC